MPGLQQQSATNWVAYNKTDCILSQKLKTKVSLPLASRFLLFILGFCGFIPFTSTQQCTSETGSLPFHHFNKGHRRGFYPFLPVTPLLHIGRTSVLDGSTPQPNFSLLLSPGPTTLCLSDHKEGRPTSRHASCIGSSPVGKGMGLWS